MVGVILLIVELLYEIVINIVNIWLLNNFILVFYVPSKRFCQSFLHGFGIGHPFTLSFHIKEVFIIVKAEIISLFNIGVYIYKFYLFSDNVVTQFNPFTNRYRARIADIKNVLCWPFFQNDIQKPTQIVNMKELKFHFTICR